MTRGQSAGFGNVDAYSDKPLTMSVISTWAEQIRETKNAATVVILNVVRLDG
jgi:hypothetical protein